MLELLGFKSSCSSPLPRQVAPMTNYTVGNFPVSSLRPSSRRCKGHHIISVTQRSATHQQTGKQLIWTVWQDLLRAFGGGGKPCSFPLLFGGGGGCASKMVLVLKP